MATLITGFDHYQVEAPAGCEAAARAFYGGFLGLPELRKPAAFLNNGGVWFALPDGRQLHVGVAPDFVPREKGHPALRCDDIVAFGAHCDAHGVSYVSDAEAGIPRVFLKDIFGNRLEVVEGSHPSVLLE
ncbi:glyoxalase [Deinococcus marmoris]|uniref:Glyoxalase/Bleomycin resistance protein/Dioxygenase superfamily n=1 Tax=Deinococcus marmoris TaxID=249408 RepID=A0A1U7NX31_9DEIO|nr:glyoxalase [Deinococcus marmoris]OLV17472.1 Glyoxalase/Bleomycin resistance protein/Dioxygenase superfamily [Deinococcus marmoris]